MSSPARVVTRPGATGTKGVPRAEREQQIRAAALCEFARDGYAGASVASVAARAGITKPLVYQYFGSKDGLYVACLDDVAGSLLDRLETAESAVDDSVASRIHPLRAIFEALEPQRAAWRLLYDPSVPADGPVADAVAGYRGRMQSLAAGGSARFLRARGLRDAGDASALTAVWMGVVSAVVQWWLDHPQVSAAAMVRRCERLLTAVLT